MQQDSVSSIASKGAAIALRPASCGTQVASSGQGEPSRGGHAVSRFLAGYYRRWIMSHEERLRTRRAVASSEPFAWGADWAISRPVDGAESCHDEEAQLRALAQEAAEASNQFFAYETPTDFHLIGNELSFTSPVQTRYWENNTALARWYPAWRKSERAVLVLPHWNGKVWQYGVFCRLLNLLGISALVVVLPYHEQRKPAGAKAAEYAVSANLGRTIEAARQSVSDIRSCADWLESQGCTRLGLVGASLGAGYGFLASAHDSRFGVNVFVHCAPSISDVVWTGKATRRIRHALQQHVGRQQLHDIWRVIDPISHVAKFAVYAKKSLLVTARYDTTFLPEHFRRIQRALAERGSLHKVVSLPCGHYSLGDVPWLALAGYHICSFLAGNL
jgi:hypothetical protein